MTNGSRAATALFQNTDGNLVLTLTNTSTADAVVPTDLLTAVFFDIAGAPSLTKTSAVICPTCSILYPPTPATDAGGGVGGEWAYKGGTTTLAFGAEYGISSTGVDIFGPGDVFGGTNLSGPASPNGPQYGITTAGDNPATKNGGLNTPIIKNQVIFTLGGFGLLDPSLVITNVTFLYGTSLTEPSFQGTCVDCLTTTATPVPEATSLLLLGTGLMTAGARRWRKRNA